MSNKIKYIFGMVVTIAALMVAFNDIDLTEVEILLMNFDGLYGLYGVLSLSVGYYARSIRWAILLRVANPEVSYSSCFMPLLGSVAVNNIFPLRAGDVIRALIFPKLIGVSRTSSAASMILERLLDVLVLVLFLCIGLYFSKNINLPWLTDSLVILLFSVVFLIFLFMLILNNKILNFIRNSGLSNSKFNRVSNFIIRLLVVIKNLILNMALMTRKQTLFTAITLSLIVWVGEYGMYYFLMIAVDLHVDSVATPLIVASIATLSTLIPSSPGYIGTFHLAVVWSVMLLGYTETQAASYAIVSHLGVWLPTTIVGMLAIFFNPNLFKRDGNY